MLVIPKSLNQALYPIHAWLFGERGLTEVRVGHDLALSAVAQR
jgi:hypothetical protein